ncbi:AAA family ATPase [Listeria aquatica]|uniref:Magnesium chelatase subunit ChII family protein n=1 Tax=Listeria aquatica FSL S10-1188 TaxID=1265818 RepID=W7B7T0_9LIST|nr:MoxR family ATPase [Listeria aquatica]EUJ18941.1 magnesium chelatase subunit ChII family protein [Listeria aquatica FSL S10-1188]
MNDSSHKIEQIIEQVEQVIVGKRRVIELSLTALFAGGHVLIEDVPGVGKTMLVRALAKSLDTTFQRIQFTPDLLPSDVTGVSVFNPDSRKFEFRPGPIMGNIILADEINRTAPRTQAALLEGMAENSVTVDGTTYPLAEPFFVMATQNPIEYEGTYALPEAQLDRFLFKIMMGYPTKAEEIELLSGERSSVVLSSVQTVIHSDELVELKKMSQKVVLSDELKSYIVELSQATRQHQAITLGASPRATIALMKAAKSFAFVSGRNFVTPDDIKYLAPFVFGHRLILTANALYNGIKPEHVIHDILSDLAVPIEKGALNE